MKIMNFHISSLKLATNFTAVTQSSPTQTFSCSGQRNHLSKLALQISCKVSIPNARNKKAQRGIDLSSNYEKHPKYTRMQAHIQKKNMNIY